MTEPTRERIIKIAKPILFNTPMTRAILDDRKTATRRVIKGLPDCIFCSLDLNPEVCYDGDLSDSETLDGLWATFEATEDYAVDFPMRKAKYKVGDYLYVRETWCEVPYEYEYIPIDGGHITMPKIAYRADSKVDYTGIWRPSIHMPKEYARIFLRVTDVRVKRLQEITHDDCFAEGVGEPEFYSEAEHYAIGGCPLQGGSIERCAFIGLWNSTVKPADLTLYGWEANPWVWVIEFERVKVDE